MTTLPDPLQALLLDQIRAKYSELRKGGIAAIVVAGIIAAVTYFGSDDGIQNLWMLAVGTMPFGLFLILLSARDPANAKCLRMLRTRWNDTVWLYAHRVTGNANAAAVRCGLSDGKIFLIPCVMGQEGVVLKGLAEFIPHASAGYTPELEAKFRDSPQSLRV